MKQPSRAPQRDVFAADPEHFFDLQMHPEPLPWPQEAGPSSLFAPPEEARGRQVSHNTALAEMASLSDQLHTRLLETHVPIAMGSDDEEEEDELVPYLGRDDWPGTDLIEEQISRWGDRFPGRTGRQPALTEEEKEMGALMASEDQSFSFDAIEDRLLAEMSMTSQGSRAQPPPRVSRPRQGAEEEEEEEEDDDDDDELVLVPDAAMARYDASRYTRGHASEPTNMSSDIIYHPESDSHRLLQ